jgi:hypothetical protein
LSLAGSTVVLGTPKDEVIRRISREADLSQIQQTDVWLVSPKGTEADIFASMGTLTFEHGHLAGASKSRGKFRENEALSFADALHDLVSELDRSGERILLVKSASRQTEHGSFRSITLQFTTRTIVVGVSDNPRPYPQVLIEEHIGWPKLESD